MTFSVSECAEMVGNACESDVNSATAPSLGYDRLYVYLRCPLCIKVCIKVDYLISLVLNVIENGDSKDSNN